MGLLMFIYAICATRTNAVYVVIFTSLILVFCLLAAAYWRLAQEDVVVGNRLAVVSPPLPSPDFVFFVNGRILIFTRALALLFSWLVCSGFTS